MREKVLCGLSVICVVVLVAVQASGVAYYDCTTDSNYQLVDVRIAGCTDTTGYCPIKIGTSVDVTAEFIPTNTKVDRLDHLTNWVINFVHTRAYVTPEACLADACPLRHPPNNTASYTASLAVASNLPPVPAQLLWQVYDRNNKMVMCYRAYVTLVE